MFSPIDEKDIPRRITNRDPTKAIDVAVAIHIIRALSENMITKKTAAELKKAGYAKARLPKNLKVVEQTPTGEYSVVCAPFTGKQGLIFPDNDVVQCSDCNTPLQIRPSANVKGVKKLCYFCSAQAALDNYWQEQDKK
jgi:hypothetical protein